MENSIVPSSLEVTNMTYAEEQYGGFVDIHNRVLTMSADNDFIEIDRSVLEMIGFKNIFSEQKDKHGNLKRDVNGDPLLKDMRNDFSSAIRYLRNTAGFIEGSSFDDNTAHFVVIKTGKTQHQYGGQNKQSLWMRKNALEKWILFYKITGHTSKNTQNGVVYFIHMEGNLNMFKVGYSTNFIKRLESLQVGNPHLLCLYKTIDNVSRKTEARLHHLFSKRHIRGEWFAITPDMIDSVCKLMP